VFAQKRPPQKPPAKGIFRWLNAAWME